jgi:7-keto-8-aminopelargonate synthetase-like enzyme
MMMSKSWMKSILIEKELYPWDHYLRNVTPTKIIVDDGLYINMSSNDFALNGNNNILQRNNTTVKTTSSDNQSTILLANQLSQWYKRQNCYLSKNPYSLLSSTIVPENSIVLMSEYVIGPMHDMFISSNNNNNYTIILYQNMEQLNALMYALRENQKYNGNIYLVGESICSTQGTIFDLKYARAICDKYNASIILDDSSAFCVVGKNGRGIEEHYNIPQSIDVIIIVFQNVFNIDGGAVIGNFKCNSPDVNIHNSDIAFKLMKSFELTDSYSRLTQLRKNAIHLRQQLISSGYQIPFIESPVVPLPIKDQKTAFHLYRHLLRNNYYVNVCQQGNHVSLKLTVTAMHSRKELDQFIQVLKQFNLDDKTIIVSRL